MAWLHPILLLAGALFIALLIWRERRRPRQAPDMAAARTERSDPSTGLISSAGNDPDTTPRSERVSARAERHTR